MRVLHRNQRMFLKQTVLSHDEETPAIPKERLTREVDTDTYDFDSVLQCMDTHTHVHIHTHTHTHTHILHLHTCTPRIPYNLRSSKVA